MSPEWMQLRFKKIRESDTAAYTGLHQHPKMCDLQTPLIPVVERPLGGCEKLE